MPAHHQTTTTVDSATAPSLPKPHKTKTAADTATTRTQKPPPRATARGVGFWEREWQRQGQPKKRPKRRRLTSLGPFVSFFSSHFVFSVLTRFSDNDDGCRGHTTPHRCEPLLAMWKAGAGADDDAPPPRATARGVETGSNEDDDDEGTTRERQRQRGLGRRRRRLPSHR